MPLLCHVGRWHTASGGDFSCWNYVCLMGLPGKRGSWEWLLAHGMAQCSYALGVSVPGRCSECVPGLLKCGSGTWQSRGRGACIWENLGFWWNICLIYSGNCVIQRPSLQLLHISGRAVASANLLCVQTSSADKAVRAHQMLSLNKTTRTICTYEKRLSVLFMKARPLLPVLD